MYRVAKTLKDQNALKMQSDGKARVVKVTTLLMKRVYTIKDRASIWRVFVPIGSGIIRVKVNDDLRDAIFGFLGTS